MISHAIVIYDNNQQWNFAIFYGKRFENGPGGVRYFHSNIIICNKHPP